MDPRHAVLFEPLSIGPKTLRNRFYQVPHASGFGTTKAASQAAFRAIKAEGGWAAVCTDYASISSDSEESPVVSADFWDGDDMRALALMTEQVHAHGALAGIELFHGGSGSSNAVSRRPLLAPSAIAGERLPYSVPKSMDSNDIERVQRLWVDAALRARDTGFDIVYVYGAHAYLLGQFLSPYFNKRTDGYGGALVARARMWLETLHRVRDAVGADCAIATRLTVDGRGTPGIEIDEALEFVRLADPLVDLWDVNAGSWPLDSGTSRYFPQGHQLPFTGRVREATDKPIVSVGRFTDADTMAALVRSGTIDVIGAARPAIADPFLPRKIAEGRLDEIRECTGSNVCILKEESFLHLGCVQNATAGEEHRRGWHPERFPPLEHPDKAVLVVGAGAAGMECAIVLGRRGMSAVHLVEAGPQIGGRLLWTRELPTLGEWGRILDWRAVQLTKLANVQVVTNIRLDAATILEYGAQIVIVATGSHWSGTGLQGPTHELVNGADAAATYVLTAEQIMCEGKRPPGPRVVVYDTDGYYIAPGLAEVLVGEGYEVHLVTPFPVVSPVSDETLEGELLRRQLHNLGVHVHRDITVTALHAGGVHGHDEFDDPWSMPTDATVLVTQQVADDQLYQELRADPAALATAGIEAVHRIGDCLAPRMISESVFDGRRLAMEIESSDPSVPLPYDREQRYLWK
ncbi:MAG: FAD-dependent oxidoreductase [Candidatus Nanopelagicales bacterium]